MIVIGKTAGGKPEGVLEQRIDADRFARMVKFPGNGGYNIEIWNGTFSTKFGVTPEGAAALLLVLAAADALDNFTETLAPPPAGKAGG